MKINLATNPISNSSFTLKRLAFSLSEVLITLGVLGMIADLTLPGLVASYNEQTTIVKLKRAYAITSNAFNMAVANNGTPDGWELGPAGSQSGLSNLNNIISGSLNVMKNCGTSSGCFPSEGYKNMKGVADNSIDANTDYTKMLLPDGTALSFQNLSADCSLNWGNSPSLSNVCGTVGIDLNGNKAPNVYGQDYFSFVITKYGIIPMGTPEQNTYPFSAFCSMNSNAINNHENGQSCTAWVLFNNNTDYLECETLNWNNKTSCEAVNNNAGGNNNGNNGNGSNKKT